MLTKAFFNSLRCVLKRKVQQKKLDLGIIYFKPLFIEFSLLKRFEISNGFAQAMQIALVKLWRASNSNALFLSKLN